MSSEASAALSSLCYLLVAIYGIIGLASGYKVWRLGRASPRWTTQKSFHVLAMLAAFSA